MVKYILLRRWVTSTVVVGWQWCSGPAPTSKSWRNYPFHVSPKKAGAAILRWKSIELLEVHRRWTILLKTYQKMSLMITSFRINCRTSSLLKADLIGIGSRWYMLSVYHALGGQKMPMNWWSWRRLQNCVTQLSIMVLNMRWRLSLKNLCWANTLPSWTAVTGSTSRKDILTKKMKTVSPIAGYSRRWLPNLRAVICWAQCGWQHRVWRNALNDRYVWQDQRIAASDEYWERRDFARLHIRACSQKWCLRRKRWHVANLPVDAQACWCCVILQNGISKVAVFIMIIIAPGCQLCSATLVRINKI